MKKCGIYEIVNIVNGDRYIGSSVNLTCRRSTHFRQLLTNTHHSVILQKAYIKYVKDSFKFNIICECSVDIKVFLEQQYINSMKPLYNISKSSKCPMLGRKHSPETLEKLKLRNYSKGDNHYMKGKKWSEKQRRSIMTARNNSKKPRSIDSRNRMSKIAKEKNYKKRLDKYIESCKIKVIDNFGTEYDSLGDAANIIGVSVQSICDNLKGRTNLTKGKYKLKYLLENK